MKPKQPKFIWQQPSWRRFAVQADSVAADLARAHKTHGVVEGQAAAIGVTLDGELAVHVLSAEVIATAAIEGQHYSAAAVRSSVLRRFGLPHTGGTDRHVDGLVEVINDATDNFAAPLEADRLCRWQSALFPGGTSGIQRIAVGRFRDHAEPMQIVSGQADRETVHYEAPPSRSVPAEMDHFLEWFNATDPTKPAAPGAAMDGFTRAAIAHLWFELIHPFEDGNGRVGRAVMDMAIAQHQGKPLRLYSVSQQLMSHRAEYYEALNQAARGTGDVTEWVRWFARQVTSACEASSTIIDQAIQKQRLWQQHEREAVNPRQRKVLQRLLDDGDGGFAGGLNAEKYMKMTGASKPTATRDLAAMVAAGQLWTSGAGKAVRYYVAMPGWTHGVEARNHEPPGDP